MILTPTTFVIGAGASCPHGLPAAKQLHEQARTLKPESDLYQLLLQSSITPKQLNDFLEDLGKHPAQSIDAYLETRANESATMNVGKAVIAALMGKAVVEAQNSDHLPPEAQDWLGYVFRRMLAGARTYEEFAKRNSGVRFVTFNFDTIIENRLAKDFSAAYRVELTQATNSFSVTHVHGKLPKVPTVPIAHNRFGYYPPDWVKWIDQASSTINITLDEIDKPTLEAAQAAVTQSKVLCFLGFAYSPENLKRLNLPDVLNHMRNLPEMYGSAYKLSPGEQANVRYRLHNKIELSESHCLDVLRGFHIFKD